MVSASLAGRVTVLLTRNPPLVAALAGLLVPVSLAPHPLVVASHVVVDALLAIGFFAVGVYVASEQREDDAPLLQRPDRRVGIALCLRFLVNPALFCLVERGGSIVATPRSRRRGRDRNDRCLRSIASGQMGACRRLQARDPTRGIVQLPTRESVRPPPG